MVRKIFIFILAIITIISIYLTLFELLLYTFHSPLNSQIKEPLAHDTIWMYLLKQQYMSLIELDFLTIHEKRHLLDVKRIFEKVYIFWIIFSSSSFLIFVVFIFKLKELLNCLIRSIVALGVMLNILLVLLSFNFLNGFKVFHSLFFTQKSWVLLYSSIIIDWFPLRYFQEFLMFFLLLSFFTFILLYFLKKLHWNKR